MLGVVFFLGLVESIIRAYRRETADGLVVLRLQRKLVIQWRRSTSPRRNSIFNRAYTHTGSRRKSNSAQACKIHLFRKILRAIQADSIAGVREERVQSRR